MKSSTFLNFLVTAGLLCGCHKPPPAEDATDVRVEGNAVVIRPGSPPAGCISVATCAPPSQTILSFNGRLVWDENVTTRLFTPFAGRVIRIMGEVGQLVETGGPLVLIASADFGQAQADACRAATDMVLADRTLTRLRDLFEHGAVPLKDVQSAEADFERARLEKERTAGRLALYGAATNGVDQAYMLRSPIGGVVVEKNISPGAELRSDQMLANTPQLASPLFVITDPERLWVLVDLPERDQARVSRGQKFSVKSASLPNQTFVGSVDLLGDGLDPTTRTVRARGSVANPGRLLKAEMFVKVEVPVAPEAGVVVPPRAVFLRGDQHCVMVEDSPGRYTRREVTLGAEHRGQMLIASGLEAGQRVVTDGAILLEQLLATGQ